MPNRYELKLTPGAIALGRRWEADPDSPSRPPLGGGGSRAGFPGPSTAGRVQRVWSAKSRRRMRFDFGALPWEMLGARPVMITLTYPGEWELWVPDARTFVRQREALKERWRRKYGGPIGVWVAEFQRRGAPHLHLYVGLPDAVSDTEYTGLQRRTIARRMAERQRGSYEARKRLRAPKGEFAMWLRTAWWEIVGSGLPAHHGRGVDIAAAFFSDQAAEGANRVRVAEYFWRESGKWAQKNPPEDFGPLKFYGRWGDKQGFKPRYTEHEMDERVGLELRRMLRRMMLGKLREAAERSGRKVTRNAGRSRGRDGLTVFNVDGREVGPRLLACAEEIATYKAALAADQPTHAPARFRPGLIRAISEFSMDDAAWGPDERELDPDFDPVEEALIAHFQQLAEEEEAAENAIIAAEIEKLRAFRRHQLRQRDGWKGSRKRG